MTRKYMLFDVESIPDDALINHVRYGNAHETVGVATEAYRNELIEEGKPDFIPANFQRPVSIAVALLDPYFRLKKLLTIEGVTDNPGEPLAADFWDAVTAYKPILVGFNIRGFDIPLLTYQAFRHSIRCPAYFASDRYGYRYRFTDEIIDIMDWITAHGSSRATGGLDLLAKLCGSPGKVGTSGSDVSALFRAGRHEEISGYCLRDVLDTYAVFIRTRVLTGQLTRENADRIISKDIGGLSTWEGWGQAAVRQFVIDYDHETNLPALRERLQLSERRAP